jgi:hypothetical protein
VAKSAMKRTTLVLTRTLHTRLKKAAIDEGRDMQDLIADALSAYLDEKHSLRRD